MTDAALEEPARSLSLYFRLQPGERVDLEVAAQSAIAWAHSLRAAALAIDPESELRVEIVDADESSLIINAALRWVRRNLDPAAQRLQEGWRRLPATIHLALALATFVFVDAIPAIDSYSGDETLSDAELAEVRDMVAKAHADHQFQTARRELYAAVQQDRSVTAIGVKVAPRAKPLAVVESRHFAEAGGLFADREQDAQQRTTSSVMDVVLLKPALKAAKLTWQFEQLGIGKFDAVMGDPAVLEAMRDKGLPERVREGIPMRIRLEVHETAVDGEWKVDRRGRIVTHVLSPALD